MGLTSNAALRGTAALDGNGTDLALEPRSDGGHGVFAVMGDPRQGGTYRLQLGVNGAQMMRCRRSGGANPSFLALAATMWATRNEDWYGPGKPAADAPTGPDAPAAPDPWAARG